MITHIKGKLVEKSPTSVIIEVNGIGYLINISSILVEVPIPK